MFIYKIINVVNNKFYVGKTKHPLNVRLTHHWWSRNKNRRKMPICAAMIKYGRENFQISLLETVQNSESNEKEKYWIRKLKPDYNVSTGGQGGTISSGFFGHKHSAETRKQMSKIHRLNYDGRLLNTANQTGENNSMAKLSEKRAQQLIFDIITTDKNNRELGEEYGLHKRYISLVRNKHRWKHLWRKVDS